MITGLDAVDNALPVGTRRYLCNIDAAPDDGVIVLSLEDPSSAPDNRIWSGQNELTTFEDRYTIGTGQCAQLLYVQALTTSAKRWMLVGASTRAYRQTVQDLEIFPTMAAPPITGRIDNWNPADTCPQVGGPHGASCEAGGSGRFGDYTYVVASTVDATGATLTGMVGPGANTGKGEGMLKLLFNDGPGPITILHHDSDSLPQNFFNTPASLPVVINPGETRMFYTNGFGWTLVGASNYFDGQPVTMRAGLQVRPPVGTGESGTGNGVTIQNTLAGRPGAGGGTVYAETSIFDEGTYDTTLAQVSSIGITADIRSSRSAGSNDLTNIAGYFSAQGGTNSYSLMTQAGAVGLGLGATEPIYLGGGSIESGSDHQFDGRLLLGASNPLTLSSAIPAVDRGILDSRSTNAVGRISAIDDTNVTLTFGGGGFQSTAFCFVQVEGAALGLGITVSSVSSGTAVFSCFATTTAQPAECPSLAYHCWGG